MAKANVARQRAIQETSRAYDAVIFLICLFACVVTIYPIYFVFIMSISGSEHSIAMDVFLWPKDIGIESYRLLLRDMRIFRAYGNTIYYTAASTVLMLVTSVTCAYPLTVKGLWGRKWVVTFLLIPMYFGGGLIPSYLLISNLGFYDTPWAIILPASFGVMNIILVRTNFIQVPESLRESARIAGANHFRIMKDIYIPISTPVIAVIAIYAIVNMWNSWFTAQVYLPNTDLHPLQLYLQRVLIQQSVDLTKLRTAEDVQWAMEKMFTAMQLKYSMIIFTIAPVLLVYPFFQRYFVKGIMVGSLKE